MTIRTLQKQVDDWVSKLFTKKNHICRLWRNRSFEKLSLFSPVRGLSRSYQNCRDENANSRYGGTDSCLNLWAMNQEIPRFFLGKSAYSFYNQSNLENVFAGRAPGIEDHPAIVDDKVAAQFFVISLHSLTQFALFQFLPTRQSKKPYLCFVSLNLDQCRWLARAPFFKRKDIIFLSHDLGDIILTSDGQYVLSGVTIPSFKCYSRTTLNDAPRNNLISFKGNCDQHGWFDCCQTRLQLKSLVAVDQSPSRPYVFLDTCDEEVHRDKESYFALLHDSTFAFVPHGDGRWSHRLIEVIGAGSIPVIISDALTLPFEQLINYDGFVVRISEHAVCEATMFDDILDLLPTDPHQISEMQQRITEVYQACFRSLELRVTMLLLSAQQHALSKS